MAFHWLPTLGLESSHVCGKKVHVKCDAQVTHVNELDFISWLQALGTGATGRLDPREGHLSGEVEHV